MFEWLNGTYYREDNFEGDVQGFNEKTNKLIVFGADSEESNEKTLEKDLFNGGIEHNIDCYDDWQKKLFTALQRDNRVYINIYSTDKTSCDSWFLEIYKNKTLLQTTDYSDPVILVNYVVVFCGEIKGEVLTYQDKNYLGSGLKEEKLFNAWIEEQIENVGEFNHTAYWSTFSSIIASSAFNTDEEMKIMNKLFSDKLDIRA